MVIQAFFATALFSGDCESMGARGSGVVLIAVRKAVEGGGDPPKACGLFVLLFGFAARVGVILRIRRGHLRVDGFSPIVKQLAEFGGFFRHF